MTNTTEKLVARWWVFVSADNAWGCGDDFRTAKQNALRHGHRRGSDWYAAGLTQEPAELQVDPWGGIHWSAAADGTKVEVAESRNINE